MVGVMTVGLLCAGVGVIVVIAAGIGGRRRRKEVMAWAQENGWRYVESDSQLRNRWSGVPFERGIEYRAEDALYGTVDGRQAVWFVYRWKTRERDADGDTTTTWHTRQVMALTLPAALPELLLWPENFFSKLKSKFGRGDLQIGVPEFDRRWQIRADDEGLARYLLHPAMQEFLMQQCQQCSFRIVGDTILLWKSGRHRVADLPWFRWRLSEFARLVPADVWANFARLQSEQHQGEWWPTSGPAGSAPASTQPGQWWSSQPPQQQGPQWLGTPGGPIQDAPGTQ